MIRICLVIPSLQAGGMERVMSELASYFVLKPETEVHLILYGLKRDIFYNIPDTLLVHKPSFRFNNKLRVLFTIRTLFYLRREIKKLDPHSILSFGEYWNNFFLLATLGLKYPRYVSDRSQPDKSLGHFHDFLRQKLYPTTTGLILQTQKAKEIYLRSKKHDNIIVIGNPIREIISSHKKSERRKTVLMVGRLIKSKHQDMLIEMFARTAKQDWKLVIVGYDHLRQSNLDALKQLAEDLGIKDRVIFTGKINNVEDLYLESSIFAFTSSSEGFPNAIGEAMSAGLPVVAFDCVAGPSDMITDGQNGFLVPLFDKNAFESRLIELMSNKALRLRIGSSAREGISKYSNDKICEDFYNVLVSENIGKR